MRGERVLHCCRGVVMEPNGSLSSATATTDGEFFQDLTAFEVAGGLNPVMIPVSPSTAALLNGVAGTAVPGLVAVAVARGFTGYVIDYEPHTNLTATHARLLGAWLTTLSSALHAAKKELAVCVSDWGIIGKSSTTLSQLFPRMHAPWRIAQLCTVGVCHVTAISTAISTLT